jgi:hypothetical protein
VTREHQEKDHRENFVLGQPLAVRFCLHQPETFADAWQREDIACGVKVRQHLVIFDQPQETRAGTGLRHQPAARHKNATSIL